MAMRLEDAPPLLTMQEVGARHHVAAQTVRDWIRRYPDFPVIREGKRWKVRLDLLLAWEAAHSAGQRFQ